MKPEISEQVVRVEVTLSEWKRYQEYLKRARLKEVTAVLRQIESEGKKKADVNGVVKTIDPNWLQDWKRRKEKEDSDKLEEQRKQEAMSPAERLAEVDAVLKLIGDEPQS